jgi:hypothetical protein
MQRALLLFAVLASACSVRSGPADCQPPNPPAKCVDDVAHVDAKSVATFSSFGAAHGTSRIGVDQPCTLTRAALGGENVPGLGFVPNDHYLSIDSSVGKSHIGFLLSDLGDPRTWPETQTLPGPCLPRSGITASEDGGAFCSESSVCGATITITTEKSVGGAAPAPRLVTADYERTFRIDVDATHANLTTCDASTSFSAQLWITQTASDWAAHDCTVSCE